MGFLCCSVEWKLHGNISVAGNYALDAKNSFQLSVQVFLWYLQLKKNIIYKWPDSETLTRAGQYLAIEEILERQGSAQRK